MRVVRLYRAILVLCDVLIKHLTVGRVDTVSPFCPSGNENKMKGLCSIGRTKTKSGRAETDKSKLNRKRVIEVSEKVAAKRFKTEKRDGFYMFHTA